MATLTNTNSHNGWSSTMTVSYTLSELSDTSYKMTGTITEKYTEASSVATHSGTTYTRVALSWNYVDTWEELSSGTAYPYHDGQTYNSSTVYDYKIMNTTMPSGNSHLGYDSYHTRTTSFSLELPRRSNGPLYWELVIWNLCASNSSYTAGQQISVPIAKHRIIYRANGGTGAPASQVADYNKIIAISTTKPTRDNRTFLGWSKTSSGTAASDRAPGGTFPANTASEMLYAVWSPELRNLTVSREAASGTNLLAAMGLVLRTQFYINDYTSCKVKVGSTEIPISTSGNGSKNLTFGSTYLNTTNFDPTKSYTISIIAENSKGRRTVSATLPASGYTKPTITSASAYRCNDAQTLVPADDGIYPALKANGQVYRTKNTNNEYIVTCSIRLLDEDDAAIGQPGTPAIASTLFGVSYVRNNVTLDPEKYYKYEITIADPLYSVTRTVVIDTAFMAMDILGDMLWYQPSTDTSVVSGKKYFTKTTVNGVDTYTRVESPSGNPSTSDYYERSGDRPASGVAFGTSSDSSGFRVAMPTRFEQGVTAYNGYDYPAPRYATLDDRGLVYHDSHGNDQRVFRIFDNEGENSGNAVVIGAGDDGDMGGAVMIGAGECAQDIDELTDVYAKTEDLFLAADGMVRMYPAWANKAQINAYQSGTITKIDCIAGSNNNVVLGTSSNNGVTAQTYIGELHFKDKNKESAAMLGARTNVSDNAIYAYMGARNCKTDGTFVSNYIHAIVKKDGTRAYKVDDQPEFRKAISGLGGDKESTSYYGLVLPDGTNSGWLRTTSSGLIPYSSNSSSGASAIGTSNWPFASGYFKALNVVSLSGVTSVNGNTSPKFTDTHGSISTTTITYTGTGAVSANASVSVTLDTASASVPSGYVFTGVKQVTTSDSGCGAVGWFYGGTSSTARLRNFTSTAKNSVTVTMVATYIKLS